MSDATPFQRIMDILLQLETCISCGYMGRAEALLEDTMDNLREILAEEHTQISDNTSKQALTAPMLQSMMALNSEQIRVLEVVISGFKPEIEYCKISGCWELSGLFNAVNTYKTRLKRLVGFQKALKKQYKEVLK